jgi:hypothetical protein
MTDTEVPEIGNPRRILAVSLEDEANHLSRVLKGEPLILYHPPSHIYDRD